MAEAVTRLAPSPTGALHLGNVRTFLINWAAARQSGWRVVMRLDDLDSPRVKPGADQQAMADLQWLGLDWDGQPIYQTHDLDRYQIAINLLRSKGLVYPCPATRSEVIAAAAAPHVDEHEVRYPGLYRPPTAPPIPPDVQTALRVIVPDGLTTFTDEFQGPQAIDVQASVGDFIVESKSGVPAYQLAVVVDDSAAAVNCIVRGDDLMNSTARQLYLYKALGFSFRPRYWHVPLVYGADGHRLAKRHGDTRVNSYRQLGVQPERIIGLIAYWSGLCSERRLLSAQEFKKAFSWSALPREPVTMTQEDSQWLSVR